MRKSTEAPMLNISSRKTIISAAQMPHSSLAAVLLALFALIAVFNSNLMAQAPAADAGKPAILALDYAHEFPEYWDPKVVQEMLAAGFEVGNYGSFKLDQKKTPTFEQLKVFNVVLLLGASHDFAAKLAPVLDRYLQEGGGVLAVPAHRDMYAPEHASVIPVLKWLKGYGATIRTVAIQDSKRKVKLNAPFANNSLEYAWTSGFTDHPVTRGMRYLWYPLLNSSANREFFRSTPVEVSGDWQALVQSGPESEAVAWGEFNLENTPLLYFRDQPEKYFEEFLVLKGRKTGPQPLLAVRGVGKGRLAVLGLSPRELWWAGYVPTFDGLALKKGMQDKPSDGWLMLSNLYRWLGEPSLQAGNFGGFQTDRTQVFRKIPGAPRLINWDDQQVALGLANSLGLPLAEKEAKGLAASARGLIGAHTAYSTGKGSVRDWVAQARAAGWDFLVFMEDYEHMNAPKWNQLCSECAAVSDPAFLAYPGLEASYQLGDHFFLMCRYLPWPDKPIYLTRDGKKFESARSYNDKPGRYLFFLGGYAGVADIKNKVGNTVVLSGHFRHRDNPTPTWNYTTYRQFAVFTCDRKGWIDNHIADYLALQSQKQTVCPLAINLMYDPAEIKQAAGKRAPFATALGEQPANVDPLVSLPALNEGKPFVTTLGTKTDLTAVGRALDTAGFFLYGGRGSGLCASTGPDIITWNCTPTVAYVIERWNTAKREEDYYALDNYRYRIRLAAKSALGLAEVVIHDGDKGVCRRFLPNGATAFEATLDLENDRVRNLVAVVRDRKGGVAVSPDISTENWLHRLYWCSDRENFGGSPHGHNCAWVRPAPSIVQHGPEDRWLAQWKFPIVAPDLRIQQANFSRRFEMGMGYPEHAYMGNFYRTEPLDDMTGTINHFYWGGQFGGPIFFWEESNPANIDGGRGPEPAEPFYEECRWTPPPERDLPKWELARHTSKDFRLLKDVEYVEPWIVAFTPERLDRYQPIGYAPGGQYEFRLGDKVVKGTLPKKGEPELREEGAAQNGGVFALDCTNVTANVAYVGGKDLRYEFKAKDGCCTLQVGWPATAENSRKGTEFRHEIYSLKTDGPISAGLDGLMKAPGISVETGARRAGVLPYTFEPKDGAVVLRLGDVRTPEEWVHCVVEKLNPHWTAYYREIGVNNRIRPIGVDPAGKGCVTFWREKKNVRAFIGHPILCSDDGIYFDAVRCADGKWILEINNPTDQTKTISFSWNKAWPGRGALPENVPIEKGGRVNIALKEEAQ